MTGAEVKAWREALGLSQTELAERLPMAVRTLQAWERGRGTPPPFMSRALAHLKTELRGLPIVIRNPVPSPWTDANPPDLPPQSTAKADDEATEPHELRYEAAGADDPA